MSERASLRFVDDERAEFGVSALMFLSVVLVSTSILTTFLLSIAERTMVDGRETAHSQSDVVNGIISVTYIELTALNAVDGDEIHVVFELPYLVGTVEDVSVDWVLMCQRGPGPGHPGANDMRYNNGNFEDATSVVGDGRTAAELDFFDSSGIYHVFLPINAGTGGGAGDCDLDDNFDGQFVIAMERGRTFETRIQLGDNPQVGDQLL